MTICACRISARRLASAAGAAAGLSIAGCAGASAARRLVSSATWREAAPPDCDVARNLAFSRSAGSGTNDRVRPGLSLRPSRPPQYNRATQSAANIGRVAASVLKLSLTERFGQDIFARSRTIAARIRSIAASIARNLSREAKPMVAATADTRSASSATRTARSAARLWTAHARCSWISASTAPAWARSRASAGVSKGTLYVYFADKSRLFEAIVEHEAIEQGKVGVQLRSRARRRDHAEGFRPGLYRDPVPPGRRLGDAHGDGDRRADAGRRPPLLRTMCSTRPSPGSPPISKPMSQPAISRSTTASSRPRNSC